MVRLAPPSHPGMTKKPAKSTTLSANLHGRKPTHWPQHVQYLNSSVYHSSLSPLVLQHIKRSSVSKNIATPPRSKVVIRAISDPSHPANGQFGLFAAQRIPPKTHILDYIGRIFFFLVFIVLNLKWPRGNSLRRTSWIGLRSLTLPASGWPQCRCRCK